MSEVRPFLATLPTAGGGKPRTLASVLPTASGGPALAPTPATAARWSPRDPNAVVAPPPPVVEPIDTTAIEEEARAKARAEGLAETAALRAQLAQAIEALTAARAALVEPAAAKIARAAAAVVGAWTESAPPIDLYLPIVRSWLAAHEEPATAHVAPAHVAAFTEAIGDAPIAVVADPTLRPGDVRLSSATLELAHHWEARLPELREAILAALEAE